MRSWDLYVSCTRSIWASTSRVDPNLPQTLHLHLHGTILHVTSTTRMHDKVDPKQAQAACINKNTSKELCSTARWALHRICKLLSKVLDSRLVQCSAGIRERAGFCSICDKHKFTYFSLAWLSDGTTAPFPLAYMVDSVWRLLTYSTPVKGSGQENGLSP